MRPKVKIWAAASWSIPCQTPAIRRQPSQSMKQMMAIDSGRRTIRSWRMWRPSSDSAMGAPTTRIRLPGASNLRLTSTMRRQRATRSAAAALAPAEAPTLGAPTRRATALWSFDTRLPWRMPIASRSPRKIAISAGVWGTTSRNGRKLRVPG